MHAHAVQTIVKLIAGASVQILHAHAIGPMGMCMQMVLFIWDWTKFIDRRMMHSAPPSLPQIFPLMC